MPTSAQQSESSLDHVVVAGGTPELWLKMSTQQWRDRLLALSSGAAAGGAHWVTLVPHHGRDFDGRELQQFHDLLASTEKVETLQMGHGERFVWQRDNGVSVIVDCMADGHTRFAASVEALRVRGIAPESVTEELLSSELLQPAVQEADVVIILGPPHVMPTSMVWELAYSELVFIDIHWDNLIAGHLESAIDDFNRRHRRFGGLDS